MNFKIILGTVLLLNYSFASEEETVETIVRIQHEEKDTKMVTMSNGEMNVNLHLGTSGDIFDCKVTRRRRMALGMIKYDVRFDSKKNRKKIILDSTCE